MESTVVLRVQGLSFSYPGRHVFTMWSRVFSVGLTKVNGSSGSGKSTLLRLLAGVLPPVTGSLRIDSVDVQQAPLAYRRQVFWCGPGEMASEHLNPLEYFAFMAGLYSGFDYPGAERTALQIGLEPHLRKRLAALSSGTQRKVWLAAALHAGTRVVLLDEPLAALDRSSQHILRSMLPELVRRSTQAWIVASHESLGEAESDACLLGLDVPQP